MAITDEQVGNQSYRTMTPGSAVAGQLQNILTSQRLEKRQAMIDEINRRNIESEMATREQNAKNMEGYRAMNAKSLEEDRASRAADREAQEEQRRGDMLSAHQP